jgi:two-component system nitrate/nitrite sensor histidine kinase NarX
LIGTLLEQLASALTLDRQTDNQQQLMLMEERSTIARELHDSLAQSLSCLKIQMACLQMQNLPLNEDSQLLIKQMREELSTAYRQLRELLTTFRLKLETPGLRSALQHTVDEFSKKMELAITFDYQLPPQLVPANQGVHLLHIAREALNNIYKHAHASEVTLSLCYKEGAVTMKITDNGLGLPAIASRQNHYGLMIMQDRASSLQGECHIYARDGGGTTVCVNFSPDPLPFTPQEPR